MVVLVSVFDAVVVVFVLVVSTVVVIVVGEVVHLFVSPWILVLLVLAQMLLSFLFLLFEF